jgi:hypothetical protein
MRIGQLLTVVVGQRIRDSSVYGRCPKCDTVSNLGSAPSEATGNRVSYLCKNVGGRQASIDVKGEMWIDVQPAKGGDRPTD